MAELYPGVVEERLPSGLKILFEQRPGRPLSLGIWVRLGSRDDPPELAGAAHFLEHMLFKGTERRSAIQISKEIDALGGEINAATSKEYTIFHVEVLPQHLEPALDVLADLVKQPRLASEEIAREKGVVLSEIRQEQDTPQERLFELFMERLWQDGHPLSWPVAGREDTVPRLSREHLVRQFAHYRPKALFLTATGDLQLADLVRVAQAQLGDLEARSASLLRHPPQPNSGGFHAEEKDTQQAHLCLGVPGIARNDQRRYPLEVLTTVLGGGMSSRLFARIREQLGLAYDVSSGVNYFQDSGLLLIYIGTEPENARRAVEICLEELDHLQHEPIADDELRLAKQKMRGNSLLGMESSHARMVRLGLSEIYGQHLPLEEVIHRLEAVTADQVQALSRELFAEERLTLAAVGPTGALNALEGLLPSRAPA
jgi:predicted Zn-dependent peptidase